MLRLQEGVGNARTGGGWIVLFRRRKPLGRWGHVRETLLPRKGLVRPFLYRAKCALRLKDNAHAIAIGVACGTFISFTPLMGLHIVLGCALAWLLSGNMVAAALGTAVGNPLTFPAIWLATHRTGTWILGRADGSASVIENFGGIVVGAEGPLHHILIGMWEPLILPMMVGGVPLGLAAGAIAYALTRPAVVAFQEARLARREKLAKRPRVAPKNSATA